MRSATSYFNPTLFRKNLARFWPVWALYGAVWLFALPVNLLLSAGDRRPDNLSYFAGCAVLELTDSFTIPMSAFFGLIAAMAVFSYLYTARSVGAIHALPLRREGLFLTNYLSGLVFFLLPNAVILAVTLLGELAAGCFQPLPLCLWFLAQLFCVLFFYSFAVFCAMFTGHILALPAFYAVLNALASAAAFLIMGLLDVFLYGFMSSPALEEAARWLTPAIKMSEALYLRTDEPGGRTVLCGLQYLLLYAGVGVLLLLLALLAYRFRRSETAGDLVAVRWVRPVFQYGFAACCAMVFGSLLYSAFSYALPDGPLPLIVFMALCGTAGYFAGAMLLQKSFRVFAQWKGCAVFLACLLAASAALALDVTGFVSRVPDPDTVVSAEVFGISSAPRDTADYAAITVTDPADLALLTELHRAFIRTRDAASEDADASLSLRMTYTLASGATLSRYYPYVPAGEDSLADPDSPAALTEQFINRPAIIREAYGLDRADPSRLVEFSLDLCDPETGALSRVPLPLDSSTARRALWEAVLADFEAGNLGRRYVFSESDARMENTYVNDLTVTFLVPLSRGREDLSYTDSITITLTPQASRTLAFLEELGYPAGQFFLLHSVWDARGEETVSVFGPDAELIPEAEYEEYVEYSASGVTLINRPAS